MTNDVIEAIKYLQNFIEEQTDNEFLIEELNVIINWINIHDEPSR